MPSLARTARRQMHILRLRKDMVGRTGPIEPFSRWTTINSHGTWVSPRDLAQTRRIPRFCTGKEPVSSPGGGAIGMLEPQAIKEGPKQLRLMLSRRMATAHSYARGAMLWFSRNRLVGSYRVLIETSRS